MATRKLAPIHPGEVLLADFLEPMGIAQYRLAHDISVPPRRVNEIVHGKRGISADTALRFARYVGTSERLWLNLQARHDLEVARDLRDPAPLPLYVLTSGSDRRRKQKNDRKPIDLRPHSPRGPGGTGVRCRH